MSADKPLPAGGVPVGVQVGGGQGVQVGSYNEQTNIVVDPAGVPPPQTPGGGVVHNLPRASKVFVGRDLEVLAAQVGGGEVGVVVGQAGAVHGLGGIGKSELVNHYARAYLSRYSLVWWITADSPENLGLGLAALTRRLHPVATLADAQAWAVGWLQSHTDWLLVLDNVEDVADIDDLLGVVGDSGQVLVTTRRDLGVARWAKLGLTPLRLGVLARPASVQVLSELTGRSDGEGAGRLAADLGDLPLALEQAAAYVSQHAAMSFDDYRSLLAGQFARVAADSGFGGDDGRAVASVWTLTMAAIAGSSRLAGRVLDVLAWLAPDELPDDVLAPMAGDLADVDDALALLASYSMISRVDRMVSVHRLVQAVTRHHQQQTGTVDDMQQQTAQLLAAAIPDDPLNNVQGWPRWAALLPHIDAFLTNLPGEHRIADVLLVWNQAAGYRLFQGQVQAAIGMLEQVLTDRRRLLGDDHPNTLRTRHLLAIAYRSAGRLDEAISMFEQVLADRQRVLGDSHPHTLITRNQLALTYQAAQRLDEAISTLEQVLADQRRVLDDDHRDTLGTRNNLAAAYLRTGRLDEAIGMFEQVLTVAQHVLGDDHPGTLTARNNLAGAYQDAGRVDEAIGMFEQVLADRRRVLGDDHPGTLTAWNNLSGAYQEAGRLDEAIGMYEQVLGDLRRVLGDDHPDTLTVRNNLGSAYQNGGRLEEAIGMLEQVLADMRRVLGDDHPNSLTARNNLAVAYRRAGRLDVR